MVPRLEPVLIKDGFFCGINLLFRLRRMRWGKGGEMYMGNEKDEVETEILEEQQYLAEVLPHGNPVELPISASLCSRRGDYHGSDPYEAAMIGAGNL